MIVELLKDGVLRIKATDPLEQYALRKWTEDNFRKENRVASDLEVVLIPAENIQIIF